VKGFACRIALEKDKDVPIVDRKACGHKKRTECEQDYLPLRVLLIAKQQSAPATSRNDDGSGTV